jgi:hypothetical protein
MEAKEGLFGFSYGNSFLAKAIKLFQIALLIARGKYSSNMIIPNHEFYTYRNKEGIICIMEMQKNGNENHVFTETSYFKDGNYFFMAPKVPWSKKELLCWNILGQIDEGRKIHYDFINLGEQAIKMVDAIKDKIENGEIKPAWIGKYGVNARDRMICSELANTRANDIVNVTRERKPLFKHPASDSPIDTMLNDNLVLLT